MMKKLIAVGAVMLSGLFLFGCQSQPREAESSQPSVDAAPQNKKDPKLVEEVKATLARHDKALNDKSIEGVMATFSTNPDTVVLGTGQGERFVGQQAIKEAYTEIFKDYDAGTLISNCDWKTGEADPTGSSAWLAATCNMQDSMKSKKRDYVLNVSAALEKQGADWRFVMLHMSNSPGSGPPTAQANPGD